MFKKKRIIIILMIIICIFNVSCTKDNIEINSTYFNTYVQIKFYNKKNLNSNIINHVKYLLKKYNKLFNPYNKSSDIYKINNSNNSRVYVSKDTIELLKISKRYFKISNGNFDPSIFVISDIWKKSFVKNKLPNLEYIKLQLSNVNFNNVTIGVNFIELKNKNTKLEFGSIAKGYIADKIKDYLISKGVNNVLINLGGNILLIGDKNNKYFNIGIENCFNDKKLSIINMKLKDVSIATSSQNKRNIIFNNKKYGHIISPKTGLCIDNDLAQVTIISKKSVDADVLSTICFILGSKNAISLIDSIEYADCILITKNKKIIFSKNIKKYNIEMNRI